MALLVSERVGLKTYTCLFFPITGRLKLLKVVFGFLV